MRMMVKVAIPVEAGNAGIKSGVLPKTIEGFLKEAKPEAAYFVAENGLRTGYFVIDMKQSSDLPWIAERFFSALNASITVTPAMNAEDLKAGVEKAMK